MRFLWEFVRGRWGEVAGLVVALAELVWALSFLIAVVYLIVSFVDGDLTLTGYLR